MSAPLNPFQDGFLNKDGDLILPEPPPWRPRRDAKQILHWAPEVAPDPDLKDRAERHSFRDQPRELEVIRAALTLRRPILVTGKPGVGKSSLAYLAAHYLGLGPVLKWNVGSKSAVEDAVYRYDAVRRLEYYSLRKEGDRGVVDVSEEGKFYRLGPLGTALLPSPKPRVLLIDEIDKSDLDVPDDLLHVLEEGEYTISELERLNLDVPVPVKTADHQTAQIIGGKLQCYEFPLIFLTSNGDRDFSSAFYRRCLRLKMERPTQKELESIVRKQLAAYQLDETFLTTMAKEFHERMKKEEVTTDQFLSLFFVRSRHQWSPGAKEFSPAIEEAVAKDTAVQDRS